MLCCLGASTMILYSKPRRNHLNPLCGGARVLEMSCSSLTCFILWAVPPSFVCSGLRRLFRAEQWNMKIYGNNSCGEHVLNHSLLWRKGHSIWGWNYGPDKKGAQWRGRKVLADLLLLGSSAHHYFKRPICSSPCSMVEGPHKDPFCPRRHRSHVFSAVVAHELLHRENTK